MTDTNWTPALPAHGPRYRALADAIANAVADGALSPGDRLPPVRDLAWRLDVTPGTVARAYQLAETKGVVEGQVGRGTFVRDPRAVAPAGLDPITLAEGGVDLRGNRAPDVGQDAVLTAALERVIARADGALPLTRYHHYGADAEERAAGSEWLAAGGVPAPIEDLALTPGAQTAVAAALVGAVGAGGVALTEPLIHRGLIDAARAIGVRLEPVAADDEGVLPDALDAACARHRPSAALLTLKVQNPTLATAGPERRAAIAEVARRRRIALVEDDVYGWLGRLEDRASSLVELAPERTWYITSFSKCVAAGLRIGFLKCPQGHGARGARILQGIAQHTPWLTSALAAELIRSGDAERVRARVDAECAARVDALRTGVGLRARTDPTVTMAWLELPDPWRASEFVAAAEGVGVRVSAAEAFAVGRSPAPHAVRIGLGVAPSAAAVADAARRLEKVLAVDPPPVDGPS